MPRQGNGAAAVGDSITVPQDMKHTVEFSDDLAIPLPALHPKEAKSGSRRYSYTPMFLAALPTSAER